MSLTTMIIIIIGIVVLVLLAVWIWYIKRGNTSDDQIFEDMEGKEFEEYCAELLEAKGFENIEITPDSHDYGVDIITDRDGVSYAIQCKCYSGPVGVRAVQEVYAGKDYYGSMVGVVMSNQSFTKSAREFAEKLNIMLWDGDHVMNLIHEVAIPEKKAMRDFIGSIGNKSKKRKTVEEANDFYINDLDNE